MSDYNDCLLWICNQFVESFLHLVLAFGIKSASRFVKKNDLRVANKSSSYSDSLLLAAGETQTALTNFGIEALWEQSFVLYKAKGAGLSTSFAHPLSDLFFTCISEIDSVDKIFFNTAWKKCWLLLDQSDLRLVVPLIVEIFDVLTREKETSFIGVIEPLN